MEDKIKSCIKKIDTALLRLSKAKEIGFTYFNFHEELDKLLTFMNDSEEYKGQVENYVFVFKDLIASVGVRSLSIKKVDENENVIFWKEERTMNRKQGVETEEYSTQHEKDDFERIIERSKETSAFREPITKLDTYLRGVKYWNGKKEPANITSDEYLQLPECVDLFIKKGYASTRFIGVPGMTFEKYLSWLNEDENGLIEIPATIMKKIPWTGTPGEFGAIMDELIDKNFIPIIKDKKNTVKILMSMFDVKNEKSEPVEFQYLYRCFGEKKKHYLKSEFKLPTSDNYNKDK